MTWRMMSGWDRRVQGRDKEAILVSFVAMEKDEIGAGRHLADIRRLNVALTRAKVGRRGGGWVSHSWVRYGSRPLSLHLSISLLMAAQARPSRFSEEAGGNGGHEGHAEAGKGAVGRGADEEGLQLMPSEKVGRAGGRTWLVAGSATSGRRGLWATTAATSWQCHVIKAVSPRGGCMSWTAAGGGHARWQDTIGRDNRV